MRSALSTPKQKPAFSPTIILPIFQPPPPLFSHNSSQPRIDLLGTAPDRRFFIGGRFQFEHRTHIGFDPWKTEGFQLVGSGDDHRQDQRPGFHRQQSRSRPQRVNFSVFIPRSFGEHSHYLTGDQRRHGPPGKRPGRRSPVFTGKAPRRRIKPPNKGIRNNSSLAIKQTCR